MSDELPDMLKDVSTSDIASLAKSFGSEERFEYQKTE